MKANLPFRLGATSYVYPADILPNVRRLAPIVDDVELVLFEVDDLSNLPSSAVVAELADIAGDHDLTYTVHLPLDLKLASSDPLEQHPSVDKAVRTIEATRRLDPWAYVVHLDGAGIEDGLCAVRLAAWREQAKLSVERIGAVAGEPFLIAIENLESYDAQAFIPIARSLGTSVCVDIGHLVKRGAEATALLADHIDMVRVLHLHGFAGGRDHRALDCLPPGLLDKVLKLLHAHRYAGVVTLEVFSESDFLVSRELVISLSQEIT